MLLSKIPISYQKMLFSKPPKSDWLGGLVYITKKHLKGCVLKNGAPSQNVLKAELSAPASLFLQADRRTRVRLKAQPKPAHCQFDRFMLTIKKTSQQEVFLWCT